MTGRMWTDVLITLALMAMAAMGGVGVAMYTYGERLQALDARVTAFETVRRETVVTDPPRVELRSFSPIMH